MNDLIIKGIDFFAKPQVYWSISAVFGLAALVFLINSIEESHDREIGFILFFASILTCLSVAWPIAIIIILVVYLIFGSKYAFSNIKKYKNIKVNDF